MNEIQNSARRSWRKLTATELVAALYESGRDPNRCQRLIYAAMKAENFFEGPNGEDVATIGEYALFRKWEKGSPVYEIFCRDEFLRDLARHTADEAAAAKEAREISREAMRPGRI